MARFRKNDFFKWAQKIKSVFCFIPHTHEGCDIALVLVAFMMIGFNPHTHEGCDFCDYLLDLFSVFQSTHPRRV